MNRQTQITARIQKFNAYTENCAVTKQYPTFVAGDAVATVAPSGRDHRALLLGTVRRVVGVHSYWNCTTYAVSFEGGRMMNVEVRDLAPASVV